MKIVWSAQAKDELREIHDYYKLVASVKVAKTITQKIISSTSKLIKNRELGRIEENAVVKGKGYRFLVSGTYKIVYRIEDINTVFVASVFDCRQNPAKMNA